MFVLGFIIGFVVAIGAVWLVVRASSWLDDSGLVGVRARREIDELEQAAILRMLEEAEAAEELPVWELDSCGRLILPESERPS